MPLTERINRFSRIKEWCLVNHIVLIMSYLQPRGHISTVLRFLRDETPTLESPSKLADVSMMKLTGGLREM